MAFQRERIDETGEHSLYRVKDGMGTRVILEPKNDDPSIVFSLGHKGRLKITIIHELRNSVNLAGPEILEKILLYLKS